MASAAIQDQLEIKFRLFNGSDIGPRSFPVATTVSTLKENLVAQWPKDVGYGPKTIKDVKLISAGKILENHITIGECRSPYAPGGVTTMHVIVQPPSDKDLKKEMNEKQQQQQQNGCGCIIL